MSPADWPLLPGSREEEHRRVRAVADVGGDGGPRRLAVGLEPVLRPGSRRPLGVPIHEGIVRALAVTARGAGPVIRAAASPGLDAAIVVGREHDLLGRSADAGLRSDAGILARP